MNTALYDEYKALCDAHNMPAKAEVKFNYVGGEAELLKLILAIRQPPPPEVVVEEVAP